MRVGELNKLRPIQDPVPTASGRGARTRLRVKMKAIDLLEFRETNTAVEAMSRCYFCARLNRGEAPRSRRWAESAFAGTLPIMQYLQGESDDQGRGTAVFALGEIGSDRATPTLIRFADEDPSPMVRRLAKEALQKVDGELPTQRSEDLAIKKKPSGPTPTDQKLAKLREVDQKIQDMNR